MEKKALIKNGLIVAILVTILLMIYAIVMGKFGVTETWAGFLFFYFWGTVRESDPKVLQYDIPSSLVGIGLGGLIFWLLHNKGEGAYLIGVILVIIFVLFFSQTNLIPHIVNKPTFLFFTVLTANLFLAQANYLQIFISYIIGAMWFYSTLTIMTYLLTKSAKKKAAKAQEKAE